MISVGVLMYRFESDINIRVYTDVTLAYAAARTLLEIIWEDEERLSVEPIPELTEEAIDMFNNEALPYSEIAVYEKKVLTEEEWV